MLIIFLSRPFYHYSQPKFYTEILKFGFIDQQVSSKHVRARIQQKTKAVAEFVFELLR
jgi:hypothetical protein